MAISLKQDHVTAELYETFKHATPEITAKLLELDKTNYPNLWQVGNILRLQQEEEVSKRLYRAFNQ